MADSPWRAQLAQAVTRVSDMPGTLSLTPDEQRFFESDQSLDRLSLKVSPAIMDLMTAGGTESQSADTLVPADHPLRREFIPTGAELESAPDELDDPLGELAYSPLPRLVHRYPDRALLLVTDQCAVHCRYCFRSRFTGGALGAINDSEIGEVVDYLAAHTEIRELLLSGGDALMLGDSALARVLSAVRRVRPKILIRVATRLPVVLPSRVTEELVETLRMHAPVWCVLQVNHIAELGAAGRRAITQLADGGVPLLNQAVLLRGVNDSPHTLLALFTELTRLRVKPYYLFQGDLAPGTAHFRVNLERALSIVADLRSRLSGLAMPVFAVDIPGGGGKVPLEPSAFDGRDKGGYRLRDTRGSIHHYPVE